jgi:replicative DNA helicase
MKKEERLHAEKTILATMLDSNNAFLEMISFGIDRDLFQDNECKMIFDLITNYFEKNRKCPEGVIPLYEHAIIKDGTNKTLLMELIRHECNYRYMDLIKTLLDDSCKSSILKMVHDISKSDIPGIDLAFEINKKISSFIFTHFKKYDHGGGNFKTAETVLKNIKDIMEGKTSDYIPTGFKGLDKKIIGFHKKSISTIAARPGMGKTAFLLHLKRNLTASGHKVGIISLEMDKESLWVRDMSANTKIDSMKIDSGNLTDQEYSLLEEAAEQISLEDCIVDDSPKQTVKTVMNSIQRWKIQNGVDIVFVDYLTLLKSATPDKYGRYDLEIGKMTEELRIFSKDTETPIVILSQLNREVEKRNDKRPQLADLRESGSIEQDSRLVMFLYRPYYYGVDYTKEGNHIDLYTENKKIIEPAEYLEVIIAKNRGGLTGRVPLQYQREIHTFKNLYTIHEIE